MEIKMDKAELLDRILSAQCFSESDGDINLYEIELCCTTVKVWAKLGNHVVDRKSRDYQYTQFEIINYKMGE